jgi:hypothetical protein
VATNVACVAVGNGGGTIVVIKMMDLGVEIQTENAEAADTREGDPTKNTISSTFRQLNYLKSAAVVIETKGRA